MRIDQTALGAGLAAVLLLTFSRPGVAATADTGDAWLSWSAQTAETIGKAMRHTGRVGGAFDLRVKSTNKAYNYKLRATWLTPEVMRAGARLLQLQERLSDDEARQLVVAAERAAQTIVLVELDPREGSGVIPLGWSATLQPKGRANGRAARGTLMPRLRDVPVLKGVDKRDYAYDVFWIGFEMERDGMALFEDGDVEAELVVRIEGKEGRVEWEIPPSIRIRRPRGEATAAGASQ